MKTYENGCHKTPQNHTICCLNGMTCFADTLSMNFFITAVASALFEFDPSVTKFAIQLLQMF